MLGGMAGRFDNGFALAMGAVTAMTVLTEIGRRAGSRASGPAPGQDYGVWLAAWEASPEGKAAIASKARTPGAAVTSRAHVPGSPRNIPAGTMIVSADPHERWIADHVGERARWRPQRRHRLGDGSYAWRDVRRPPDYREPAYISSTDLGTSAERRLRDPMLRLYWHHLPVEGQEGSRARSRLPDRGSRAARQQVPFDRIARDRVHQVLGQEREIATGSISLSTVSGLEEDWAWTVREGRLPETTGGRLLIGIEGGWRDPLAGIVWSEETGAPVVTHLWVDPEARRRGIGRAMLDLYRRHVARDLVLSGPFSPGGRALARAAGARIVNDQADP